MRKWDERIGVKRDKRVTQRQKEWGERVGECGTRWLVKRIG